MPCTDSLYLSISTFNLRSPNHHVRVIAHENVPVNLDRYMYTTGYNGTINQRQFQLPAPYFPTSFRFPDTLYRDTLTLTVGDQVGGKSLLFLFFFFPEKVEEGISEYILYLHPGVRAPPCQRRDRRRHLGVHPSPQSHRRRRSFHLGMSQLRLEFP